MTRLSVVLFLTLAATTTVLAQPRSKADERFEEGRKLMEAGKYDDACTAFEDSEQLDPAITTLLNLGACREKAGELASAVDVFRAAVRAAQQDGTAKSKELGDIAAGHVKRLEPRVSTLTIMVAREQRIPGLTIDRNGARIDKRQWDLPVQLDGGSYEIVASAPGHESWSTTIKIKREGDTKTIYLPDLHASTVTTAPANPANPPTDDDDDAQDGGGRSIALPIAFGVAALAAGGTSYYFFKKGADLYDQSKQEPDPNRQDSLWHSANTHRYIADGLVAGGVGLAAVSVWLFVRGGSHSTAVTPSATSDGASVTISGRF